MTCAADGAMVNVEPAEGVVLTADSPSFTVRVTFSDDDICTAVNQTYTLSYTYTGSDTYTVVGDERSIVTITVIDGKHSVRDHQ